MVSIVTTIVIMIVLTLITLGFSQAMRREQRQALDRQLSTQAFYAAESGINDAIEMINNETLTIDKTECTTWPIPTTPTSAIDATTSYTCLLIDQTPSELEYDSISTNNSTIVPVKSAEVAPISSITISWQEEQGNFSSINGCTNFPQTLDMPVLRVSITPDNQLDRTNLINNTFTAFLYPRSGGSACPSGNSVAYEYGTGSSQNQGQIVDGQCNGTKTPRHCSVTITGVPFGAATNYIRLKSIYTNSAVTIQAFDYLNKPLTLTGAQAEIDSTGKANDVLRRVKVRVPINDGNNYPEYALEAAGAICKRYSVWPGGFSNDDSSPACAL